MMKTHMLKVVVQVPQNRRRALELFQDSRFSSRVIKNRKTYSRKNLRIEKD